MQQERQRQVCSKPVKLDVIPESHYNLISIMKLMEEGHKVRGIRRMISLSKKADESLSLTSESKPPKEYCAVHTPSNLSLTKKSLQK